MIKKTIKTTIVREGSACFIPIDFDPKAVFGKVRAPVWVTLNGYTYRSTIASMGGQICLPLRKSNREAAGIIGGETLNVEIALDTDKRIVELPLPLDKQLTRKAREQWNALSYTRQKEYAELIAGAKAPETRDRRIKKILHILTSSIP